jgi:hypothetical protein
MAGDGDSTIRIPEVTILPGFTHFCKYRTESIGSKCHEEAIPLSRFAER